MFFSPVMSSNHITVTFGTSKKALLVYPCKVDSIRIKTARNNNMVKS